MDVDKEGHERVLRCVCFAGFEGVETLSLIGGALAYWRCTLAAEETRRRGATQPYEWEHLRARASARGHREEGGGRGREEGGGRGERGGRGYGGVCDLGEEGLKV